MAIQRVLSSASRIRLVAPGCPSLMATGAETVLLVRFTTVRLPAKRVWPCTTCGCWPTTYMVGESMSALLAPPGMGIFPMGATLGLVHGPFAGRLHGSRPDCWARRKIMGATG